MVVVVAKVVAANLCKSSCAQCIVRAVHRKRRALCACVCICASSACFLASEPLPVLFLGHGLCFMCDVLCEIWCDFLLYNCRFAAGSF